MSEPDQSLVPFQASLFSDDELDLITIDQPETRKRYTAASLERHVAKRDAIVRALAEGWGLLRIASVYGVSHHLVSALRDARPELVAMEKKQLSGQIGRILKMSADKFEEALVKGMVPAGQIPVAFGIFADKKAMLDGDAGLVIEHRHTIQASASGFLERLKQAVDSESTGITPIPQQKGPIVDVEPVGDTAGTLHPNGGDQVGGMVADPDPAGPGTATPGGGDALPPPPAARPMDQPDGAEKQK